MLTQALLLNPTMVTAHMNLGNVHRQRSDFESAAQHFETATQLDPGMSVAWLNLGSVVASSSTPDQASRLEKARHCFKTAMSLDPDGVVAQIATNNLLKLGNQKKSINAQHMSNRREL